MTHPAGSAHPLANGGGDVAVVVVHGVGDNDPGSTVNYVVKSLCSQERNQYGGPVTADQLMRAERQNEVFTFAEPDTPWQRAVVAAREQSPPNPAEPAHDTFTVYGRRASLPDGRKAVFYELHWADLARSGTTWWAAIKGGARFVFEIPHVVDGFLRDTPGVLSWLLRRLLLLATCFVRGPVAGYSVIMLAGGLIFLSFGWIPEREDVLAILGLKQEKSEGFVALLPDWASLRVLDYLEATRSLNARQTLLTLLASFMLAGVAVGIRFRTNVVVAYLATFVVCVTAFYLADALWMRPTRYPRYSGFVYLDYLSVMLFGLFLVGVYIFQTRRIKEVGFADLGMFMAIWAVFLILHLSSLGDMVRAYLFDNPTTISTTVKTSSSSVHFKAFALFYPYLGWLWAVWALLMAGAFALSGILYLRHWRHWGEVHRGIFVALALAVTQSCVWLTALPAIGIIHMDDVLCRGSLNYATMKQPVSCQTKLERNREAVDLVHRLTLQDQKLLDAMPYSLRDEIDATVRLRFPQTLNFDMLKAMREMAMSFIWHGFILVIVGSIAVLVGLYRHIRSRQTSLTDGTLKLPRLIINNSVIIALLAFGLVNIVLCLSWIEGVGVVQPLIHATGLPSVRQFDVPAEVVQMAMLTTIALIVIAQLPQIAMPLSGVLQIMQGLIDHHYRTRISIAPRTMRREVDRPIRRDHITRRLELLVGELITTGGYRDVILLSHSQGSVIVYDFLASDAARLGVRVNVLTAGSPLGALYSYYFNEYGDMEHALARLAPHIASWTNLYRSDDPIAGPILPTAGPYADDAATVRAAYPFHDIEMRPGGHLRYWEEPMVCDAIRNLLAGHPAIAPRGSLEEAKPHSRWNLMRWRSSAAPTQPA